MKPYDAIREKLQKGRVVVLDGAIGTEILRRDVSWADHQIRKRPEVIRAIHEDYLRAGADVITTNSFQLTRRAFTKHFRDLRHLQHVGALDLPQRADDLLAEAVGIAHQAREASGRERRAAIAGAVTTLEWCFRPDLSPEQATAEAEYRHVADVLAQSGADFMLLETMNNVTEAAAGARAAQQAGLPVWVSFVCDPQGGLFSGESLEKAAATLAPLGVEAILLNCAPPPDIETGLKKLLAAKDTSLTAGAYPHVGRFDPPEWLFTEEYPPARYAECSLRWAKLGARILGGCCGTTPEHIRALAEAVSEEL